jgi:hypothetical protein
VIEGKMSRCDMGINARFDTEERTCQLLSFADVVFYLFQNMRMVTAAAWHGRTQARFLTGTISPVMIYMHFPNSCMQFQIDVNTFIHCTGTIVHTVPAPNTMLTI